LVVDLDKNGTPEIVFLAEGSLGSRILYAISGADGSVLFKVDAVQPAPANPPIVIDTVSGNMAVADIDLDGFPEILAIDGYDGNPTRGDPFRRSFLVFVPGIGDVAVFMAFGRKYIRVELAMDLMPKTYFCDKTGAVLHTEPGVLQMPKSTGMKVQLTGDGSEWRVVDSYYEASPERNRSGLFLILAPLRKRPWLTLSRDTREQWALGLAALLVVLCAVVLLAAWLQPLLAKAHLAWILRYAIPLTTWLGLIFVGVYLSDRMDTFLDDFPGWFLGLGGALVALVLAAEVLRPTTPLNTWPDDYLEYFDQLVTTYTWAWPLLSGIAGIIVGTVGFLNKAIIWLPSEDDSVS
jgi:hypothetical protein